MSAPAVPASTTAFLSTGATAAVLLAAADDATAQALASLAAGSQLDATVSAGARGRLTLTLADGGTLSLRLPPGLGLPEGSQLTLQVAAQGALPTLRLVAINGRPLATIATAGPLPSLPGGDMPGAALLSPGLASGNPAAPASGNALGGAPIPAGTPTAPAAAGLTATVLRPGPAASPAAAPGNPGGPVAPGAAALSPPALSGLADALAPGSRLTVRIAPPPGDMPGAPPPGAPPSDPVPGGPAPPPGAGGRAPSAGTAMPPPGPGAGAAADPRLAMAPPPTPAAARPPLILPGQVVGPGASGAALVQTAVGLLSLPAAPLPPAGAPVWLEVVGPPQPPPPPATTAPPAGPGPGGWPALADAADVLARADRGAFDALTRLVPQAGPRLAASIALFAGAVRSGDKGSIGLDAIGRALEKAGRRDLAERLLGEFQDLSEEAARPRGDGSWQAITLPFAHGAQIDPVRLYLHISSERRERSGEAPEKRFILEVEMSRLGRIQFDGLITRERKRFDLIVRTAQPLDPAICRDIGGIFAECAQLTGITGTVGFQSGRGFVEVPPADRPATRLSV